MGWVTESENQEDVENILNQQNEGVRAISFSTESMMEKTDNDESSRKIRKPEDENNLLGEEPSLAEDQEFLFQEETSSESSSIVKGIIGVLYKG